MKWGLWKQKGLQSSVTVIYDTKRECLVQPDNLNASNDGWRYTCRPR